MPLRSGIKVPLRYTSPEPEKQKKQFEALSSEQDSPRHGIKHGSSLESDQKHGSHVSKNFDSRRSLDKDRLSRHVYGKREQGPTTDNQPSSKLTKDQNKKTRSIDSEDYSDEQIDDQNQESKSISGR